MRLFVALDIDEAIQQRLDDYVRTLQPRLPGVRFVRSNNYHVTLQVSRRGTRRGRRARSACGKFARTASRSRLAASASSPMHARRESSGLGCDCSATPCLQLARSVDQSLEAAGLCAGARFSSPSHVGAQRLGKAASVRGERPPGAFAQLPGIVASSPAPEFGTMTAREFFLYESRLSPSGPSYHKLERLTRSLAWARLLWT